MKVTWLNRLFIFLSILILPCSLLFRIETIVASFLTVILFWILFGIGKLLFRRKSSNFQIAVPLVSLALVLVIGKIANWYLGAPILFPTGLADIAKVRTIGQVENLATTCQIKGYISSHSGSYPISLKDDSMIYLPHFFETKDKNLAGLLRANKDKCGETFWGIE